MKIPRVGNPHLLILVDIGWFGIRAGAAYSEINMDVFRPAFIEFMALGRWRFTFEFGRIDRITWGRGGR